jgi:predicted RNA-binding Zn ribbon-like protein
MAEMRKPKTVTGRAQRAPSRGALQPVRPGELFVHQVGGHLALDFCNTAGEHLAERPDEFLRDWGSFLWWAAKVALIGPESYLELLKRPEPVVPIIKVREAIYRVGLAVAGARRMSARDLALIRKHANARMPGIKYGDNVAQWRPTPPHVSQQLCAVLAGGALSLFCSPKAARVRICEGGECGWLFLDESRGMRRRWCDMNDCGSRAKARRYYEKHKTS